MQRGPGKKAPGLAGVLLEGARLQIEIEAEQPLHVLEVDVRLEAARTAERANA